MKNTASSSFVVLLLSFGVSGACSPISETDQPGAETGGGDGDGDGDGVDPGPSVGGTQNTATGGAAPVDSTDANGDGVADALGAAVDLDGDGIADPFDVNGDGLPDGPGIDNNADGQPDGVGLDTDGDGIYDAIDMDGDGLADTTTPTGSGGTPGTGGAATTGGFSSGGASGGSGSGAAPSTGGSSGAVGCSGAEFCDDFEDGIDAAWQVQPNSVPEPVADSTKFYSGTTSMRVTGGTSQSFLAYPVPAQKFYARAYVNFAMSTSEITAHGWYIVASDNVTQGEESQIRWGSSSNHGHPELDMNVYSGTCGGEKTQFSDGASDGGAGWQGNFTDPVLLSADQWYCVEVLFDGPAQEARVWIDETELLGLHVTEESMCASWSPTYTHIKFGAGANGNTGDIWYDDVAVSTQPIGCD